MPKKEKISPNEIKELNTLKLEAERGENVSIEDVIKKHLAKKSPRTATVKVPLEALLKELGAKRAIKFIAEIRECYGDSVVELRKATEILTADQIETEIKKLKKNKTI